MEEEMVNSRGRPPPSRRTEGDYAYAPRPRRGPLQLCSSFNRHERRAANNTATERALAVAPVPKWRGARESESRRGAARFKRKARPFPWKGASFSLRLVSLRLRCCCLIGQSSKPKTPASAVLSWNWNRRQATAPSCVRGETRGRSRGGGVVAALACGAWAHTGGERTGWNLEDGDADREARRLLLWALGLGRRLAGWKLERFVRGATASLLSLALLRRSAAGHGNPAWPLPQSSPRHPLH